MKLSILVLQRSCAKLQAKVGASSQQSCAKLQAKRGVGLLCGCIELQAKLIVSYLHSYKGLLGKTIRKLQAKLELALGEA